jgi:hypothetical protein
MRAPFSLSAYPPVTFEAYELLVSLLSLFLKTNETRLVCLCVLPNSIVFCEARVLFKNSLGEFFMKPSDFYDALINKVVHFIRSVGLIKG